MDIYKVALLIDPNYAGNVPAIVEEIHPKVDRIIPVETPDCIYRIYYWENLSFSGNPALELISELSNVRHSMWQISNDVAGKVVQDNLIEDRFGIDGEIENILDVDESFTIFDQPMFQEISYERLLSLLKAYIGDDLANACDHEYVREKLDSLGCSDRELEILEVI